MNIAVRKLAMIKSDIDEREERSKVEEYAVASPYDDNFRENVLQLMEKIETV